MNEPTPAPLADDRAEVHCWWIPLDGPFPASAPESLSAEERRRAEAFATERLRRRFIAAHAALRRILSGYLGEPPEAVEILLEPHGRPVLAAPECGTRASDRFEFSLSHTDDLAVVAVGRGLRVGVDVETSERPVDNARLAPRVLLATERRWLAARPECLGRRFLRLWTAKEALLKSTGWGLHLDPQNVVVDWPARRGLVLPGFPPSDRSAPAVQRGTANAASHWHLREIVLPCAPPSIRDADGGRRPAATGVELSRARATNENAPAWIATLASERPIDTLAVFEFRWTATTNP